MLFGTMPNSKFINRKEELIKMEKTSVKIDKVKEEKVYKQSWIAIVCYVAAAAMLIFACYTAGATVKQINEYYSSYGMDPTAKEYVTYVLQAMVDPLVRALLIFMAGYILTAVRKLDPKNYVEKKLEEVSVSDEADAQAAAESVVEVEMKTDADKIAKAEAKAAPKKDAEKEAKPAPKKTAARKPAVKKTAEKAEKKVKDTAKKAKEEVKEAAEKAAEAKEKAE